MNCFLSLVIILTGISETKSSKDNNQGLNPKL